LPGFPISDLSRFPVSPDPERLDRTLVAADSPKLGDEEASIRHPACGNHACQQRHAGLHVQHRRFPSIHFRGNPSSDPLNRRSHTKPQRRSERTGESLLVRAGGGCPSFGSGPLVRPRNLSRRDESARTSWLPLRNAGVQSVRAPDQRRRRSRRVPKNAAARASCDR